MGRRRGGELRRRAGLQPCGAEAGRGGRLVRVRVRVRVREGEGEGEGEG